MATLYPFQIKTSSLHGKVARSGVAIHIRRKGLAHNRNTDRITVRNLIASIVIVAIASLELNRHLNRVHTIGAGIIIPSVAIGINGATKQGQDRSCRRSRGGGASGSRQQPYLLKRIGNASCLSIHGKKGSETGSERTGRIATEIGRHRIGLLGRQGRKARIGIHDNRGQRCRRSRLISHDHHGRFLRRSVW